MHNNNSLPLLPNIDTRFARFTRTIPKSKRNSIDVDHTPPIPVREGGGRGKIRAEVMAVVRSMARSMRKEFLCFVPSVQEAMREGGMMDASYTRLVRSILVTVYQIRRIHIRHISA